MLKITHLTFPDLRLAVRDAHKLRGYFGRVFQEYSPLLHNHLENGGVRYGYPLVQYKVIDGIPMLLGINEGATLLLDLFLRIKVISSQWEKSIRIDYTQLLAELPFVLPDSIEPYLDQLDGARLCLNLDITKKLPSQSLYPYLTTLFLFSLLLAADKGDMMLHDRTVIS